jgi:DNA-directed RNA polymerase subunit RPC12/RpoP
MKAYCIRCKNKVEMRNRKRWAMKNGRLAYSGRCAICGAKLHSFAKSDSGELTWPRARADSG